MTTKDRIKEVMSNVFDVPMTKISDESSIDNLENWDSLNHANLVMALEQEFKITFETMEIIEMLNFKIIELTINEKLISH